MVHKLAHLLLALLAVAVFVASPCYAESNNNIDKDKNNRYSNSIEREVTYGDTTREQILETRERRKRQLKNMVHDARRKLADHSAGEITLTDEKKKELEDQMDILQRKLDTMQVEMQDWVSGICAYAVL